MNANGVQDLDEKGLSNVNVTLSGLTTSGEVVTKNTVSNSAGQYLFDGLKPGKYMLVFTSPQGYQVTTQGQGGDTKNSDINQTTNRTAEITLLSGEFINTIDVGFYKFASIGNFVWEDLNANGLQDLNEQGLPNVRVSLTGTTITGENITKNTFSNAEGQYLFENLIPAKYTLTFIKPQEYQISSQGLGADAQNSDIGQTTGMTGEIVLISGELKNNIDAGFYKLATIGDFVWEDSNRNGIQDSNEKGLSNVAITLSGTTNTGETITKNMVSNGNGQYLFDKLNPGKYVLTFVSPTSYQITQASLGTDTQNSDINQITGKSSEIVLLSGSINTNIDAGFYVAGLIGDFVWDDLNGNGIQEEDEKGLPNVNINLSGTTNTGEIITKNTTSNSSGQYLFDKLNPGKYTLTFTSPQNYLITQENKGIDTKNSDISRSTGKTTEIILFSGDTKTNIDAGFYKLASIGDFVWDDLNGNGNQDLFDEKGLANVAISLSGTTINGETITKNTISNSSGQYLFDKLDLGKYILTFKSPEGYQITTEGQGINSKNSDISQTTNKTVELTLLSGEFMDNIDAGFYKLATIGNFVWEDKIKMVIKTSLN